MPSASTDVVLKNPPCFRSALLWGLGMSAVLGAHGFRTTKKIRRACDLAVGAFLVVGGGTWVFCSASYRLRARQTREFMEVMNNPERKAEAEQFLRSRVEAKADDELE